MAVRYFTMVTDDLLAEIRKGMPNWPAELRLTNSYGSANGWTLCEFEDDDAPEEIAGCLVTPTVSVEFGNFDGRPTGVPIRTWVSHRQVENGR